MLIDSSMIPEITRALELGRPPPKRPPEGFAASLGALLQLGIAQCENRRTGIVARSDYLESLTIPELSAVVQLVESSGSSLATDPTRAVPFDVFNIRTKSDLVSSDWVLFADRYRRAASRGKQSKVILALAALFREMADNVAHGYASEAQPCTAVAGFHVGKTCSCFSVADDGCGFLSSLRRNPIWASLNTDGGALSAIITSRATSRVGEKEGGGFKQLFTNLMHLNALVTLRSGAASVILKSNGQAWSHQSAIRHPVRGSQVTIVIEPHGDPHEEALS